MACDAYHCCIWLLTALHTRQDDNLCFANGDVRQSDKTGKLWSPGCWPGDGLSPQLASNAHRLPGKVIWGWYKERIQPLTLLCAVPAGTKVWISGCPNSQRSFQTGSTSRASLKRKSGEGKCSFSVIPWEWQSDEEPLLALTQTCFRTSIRSPYLSVPRLPLVPRAGTVAWFPCWGDGSASTQGVLLGTALAAASAAQPPGQFAD